MLVIFYRIINLVKIRRCIRAYQRWLALDAFDGKTYVHMQAHLDYICIYRLGYRKRYLLDGSCLVLVYSRDTCYDTTLTLIGGYEQLPTRRTNHAGLPEILRWPCDIPESFSVSFLLLLFLSFSLHLFMIARTPKYDDTRGSLTRILGTERKYAHRFLDCDLRDTKPVARRELSAH